VSVHNGLEMTLSADTSDTSLVRDNLGVLALTLLPPVLFSLACWMATEVSYLFFHALAEIFSIVIAFTSMVVATTSAKYARNHFVVFVSVAVGWCAGIDLVHTLVFKGMHLVPGDSANPATQLWLVARYMQAVALLFSPLALRRQFSPVFLHLFFGATASLLVAWVMFGQFPVAYVDGQGLTPFKIYSEFVIIGLLGLSVVSLSSAREQLSGRVYYSLVAGIVAMMLSEFAFTQYVSVYASANLIGHLLKIFAYWFVYIALVRNTIRDPFVQLQQEMHERQQLASERETLLHDLGERIKEIGCVNAVSELADQPGLQVHALLDGVARLLPPAFLLPDKAQACLQTDWGHFGAVRPTKPPRLELNQPLLLDERAVGTIGVWYPDGPEATALAFLPEEHALLRQIARLVCDAIKRMQAAQREQRLRYLYEMSSAISRSMVHAKSPQQLLDGLYDALIAHGTFPMFFFAATPGGGDMPMVLGKHYGVPPEQLDALDGVLDEAGSPVRAVVSRVEGGQVNSDEIELIMRRANVDGIPRLARWRDHLVQRGITHRVVLPLRSQGCLQGLVVIYDGGLSSFDDEQLRLLQEIASEMGFALDNFALQAQKRDAEKQASILDLRFQEVFKASPVPMQIMALDEHRTRAINDALQQWLGYSLSDIGTEESWFSQAYPEALERERLRQNWVKKIEEARAGKPVESPELQLRSKNGQLHTARGRMTVVGQDAIIAWTDLTEIRSNERALQESERRFRSMVEQTVTAMFVRRNGHFIYVNPRFCEMTGWHTDDLQGRSVLDFTQPDPDNVRHIQQAWTELHTGRQSSLSYVAPMLRKDGKFIQIGLTAKIITWDDGLPATIVLATDITEQKHAEEQIAAYVKQLESAMRGTLQAVSNMVEMRDPYTAGHERRVGLIASAIAREMGWSEDRCNNLEMLGLVHDIGKIAIPSEILTKPSRLTPLEREMMQGHVQAGYDILKDVPFPTPVAEIIRQHHERMDGSGYPQGLQGDAILPEARVLAVADVLESMASHRPYRPAVGLDAALTEVANNRGRLYAEEVVDAAFRLIHDKGYRLPS
jgi:PAS domain S-box-containing protein